MLERRHLANCCGNFGVLNALETGQNEASRLSGEGDDGQCAQVVEGRELGRQDDSGQGDKVLRHAPTDKGRGINVSADILKVELRS